MNDIIINKIKEAILQTRKNFEDEATSNPDDVLDELETQLAYIGLNVIENE